MTKLRTNNLLLLVRVRARGEWGTRLQAWYRKSFSSLRPNLSSFLPLVCKILLFPSPRVALKKEERTSARGLPFINSHYLFSWCLCSEKTDVRHPWTFRELRRQTDFINSVDQAKIHASHPRWYYANLLLQTEPLTVVAQLDLQLIQAPELCSHYIPDDSGADTKICHFGQTGAIECGHLGTNFQFLSVWGQSLQDGWTLYSKQSYGFWRENDVTRLIAKFYFNWWRNK